MEKEQTEEQLPKVYYDKGDLAYWAYTSLTMGNIVVATQVAITHLAKTKRVSPHREEFLKRARNAEDFANSCMADLILNHPTWPWASRILGIGQENYPKVVGLIEKFGRHYDPGDPMIPFYVDRPITHYLKVEGGKVVEKEGVWVEGIERLATPSKLRKYAGLSVDPETGEVPKRKAGEKVEFNMDLRMVHYRLGTSLLRPKGIWYQGCAEDGCSLGYQGYRNRIVQRKEAKGVKIIPTPKERMCPKCNTVVTAKKTKYCPICGTKLTLKNEPPGYLFTGHLHLMAMREMLQDFSLCMWLVWREALGLPVTQPYKVVKLSHKPIDPWKMVDR